jgi:hypothetical protein
MEAEKELTEEQIASLAVAYEHFTSKRIVLGPDGTGVEGAMSALMEVKMQLLGLADMYGITGQMRDIHASLLFEEMMKFPLISLLAYMDLMHQEIPLDLLSANQEDSEGHIDPQGHAKIAMFIANYNEKRLQRLRVKRYLAHLFFDSPDQAEIIRPEVLHVPDEDEVASIVDLTPQEVVEKGADSYFLRVGGLTLDTAMSKFDYDEALHIYSVVTILANDPNVDRSDSSDLKHVAVTNLTSHEDLCLMLVEKWGSLNLDPRAFVTTEGPMLPLLYENNEDPLSINHNVNFGETVRDRIVRACMSEGISAFEDGIMRPANLLLEEYTIAQLSPAFCGTRGEHRNLYQAALYDRTASGIHIGELDEEDVVFYGLRDGIKKMVVYTIEELYHAFKNPDKTSDGSGTGYFYDPVSLKRGGTNVLEWTTFSHASIRRLITHVLPYKKRCQWTKRLIEACQEAFQSENKLDVIEMVQESSFRDLRTMYRKEPGEKQPESSEGSLIERQERASEGLPVDPQTSPNETPIIQQDESTIVEPTKLPASLTIGQRVVPAIPPADRVAVLNLLLTMFNVGSDLMGYQDHIDTFNEDALHRLMTGNPFRNLPTPSDTGRPQAEARDLILSIMRAAMDLGDGYYTFTRLHILKYYDGKFYAHYDDPAYQINNYLNVLLKMAQWSLVSSLMLGGMWLMSTASYYHYKLTRRWLGGTTLNFDELTEETPEQIDEKQENQPEESQENQPEIVQEELSEEQPEIDQENQPETTEEDRDAFPGEFPEIIRDEIEENK